MLVAGIRGRETKRRKGESERRRRRTVRDLVCGYSGREQRQDANRNRKMFCTTVFVFTCTNTHTHAKAKQNAQMYAKDTKIQLKSIHKYTKDTHTLSNWACVCINVL